MLLHLVQAIPVIIAVIETARCGQLADSLLSNIDLANEVESETFLERDIELIPGLPVKVHGRTLPCNSSRFPLPFATADLRSYYSCSAKERIIEFRECPVINNGEQTTLFDAATKSCRPTGQRPKISSNLPISRSYFRRNDSPGPGKRFGGNGQVGTPCAQHTQCIAGAICMNSACACVATYVTIGTSCFRKFNPNEEGCTQDRQCSSVWPGTTCANGRCACPPGTAVAATRDGDVCAAPGECPTNGAVPKLFDASTGNPSICILLPGTKTTVGCDSWQDVYDCINDQYCCPSRALACIMPQVSGQPGAGAQSQRFAYNAVTDECVPFTFQGQGGNANNFIDREQCETYCKGGCRRGQPQYNLNMTTMVQTTQRCMNPGMQDSCAQMYQCAASGTEVCCPIRDFVCGSYGGVVLNTSAPVYPNPGTTPGDAPSVTRYYYNTATASCTPFQYNGQGGNFNNFESPEECQTFCVQGQCPRGSPQMTATGALQPCPCTGNYVCTNNFCCPTPASICQMPKDTGTCLIPAQRFWFNSAFNRCEPYQGCASANNNFDTFIECQNYCTGNTANTTAGKCHVGQPLVNQVTQQPSLCSINRIKRQNTMLCPENYECTFDGRVGTCCPMRSCVSGVGILVNITNRVVQTCQAPPPAPNTCPQGYNCQLDASGQSYVCCQDANLAGFTCSQGGTPLIDQTTRQPTTCSVPNNPAGGIFPGNGNINPGFVSQPNNPGTGNLIPIAPGSGGIPGVLPNNQQGGNITPNFGTGNFQPNNQGAGNFINNPGSGVLPNNPGTGLLPNNPGFGGFPNNNNFGGLNPGNGKRSSAPTPANMFAVQRHRQKRQNNCPVGYTCQMDASGQRGFCCPTTGANPPQTGTGAGANGGCPQGTNPLVINGQGQACMRESNFCQLSYNCYVPPGSTNGIGICCSSPSGLRCPINMQQYPPIGPVQVCIPQAGTCPSPYQCIPATTGGTINICCMPQASSMAAYCACPVTWCCAVPMRPATCCMRFAKRSLLLSGDQNKIPSFGASASLRNIKLKKIDGTNGRSTRNAGSIKEDNGGNVMGGAPEEPLVVNYNKINFSEQWTVHLK